MGDLKIKYDIWYRIYMRLGNIEYDPKIYKCHLKLAEELYSITIDILLTVGQ